MFNLQIVIEMKEFLDKVKALSWKQILATAFLVVAFVAASFFFSSCNTARTLVGGDRVVDKNVKDSTHYEVELRK